MTKLDVYIYPQKHDTIYTQLSPLLPLCNVWLFEIICCTIVQGFSDPIGLSLLSKDIVCSLSAATEGYIFEVEECSMHSFKL